MRTLDNQTFHTPVLLSEVIEGIKIRKNHWYVDATCGGGGHTSEILKKGAKVLAFDQDKDAINFLQQKFKHEIDKDKLRLVEGNFRNLKKIIKKAKIDEFDGIIFDLGTSLFQLRESKRGFSYKVDEYLDMRMSPKLKITAADIINNFSEDNLYEIFIKFGEERLARGIARAIIQSRTQNSLNSTSKLRDLIYKEYEGARIREKIHPATRVFQSLRIAVNMELDALKEVLPQSFDLLAPQGRCLVISFHSLEDRIVKKFFLKIKTEGKGILITKKPITPSIHEIRTNSNCRSAKLRIIEKQG